VFESPAGQWVALHLPLGAFRPSYRGSAVPDAPPLDGARILQLGLMIADRKFGPFELSIGAIRALAAGAGDDTYG
jgi:hypothetical protein